MATRDDVAKLAGVSSATVSRVINNSAQVNSVKTKKVLEAIKTLNYQPNIMAKSLRARRSFTIAYIVPDILDPNYIEIYVGIVEAAKNFNYQCHIIEESQINIGFINSNYDGVITSVQLESKVLDELSVKLIHEGSKPIDGVDKNLFVNHEIEGSLSEVFDLFIKKNHTKIALIISDHKDNPYELFYKNYMELANISYEDWQIIKYNNPKYQYTIGYDCMKNLLDNGPINAVLAENDLIAIGAMKALAEAGISIPDECCVVGIDDTVAAQFSNPSLTSIKKYKKVLGIYLFELLYSEITDKKLTTQVFKAELIRRDSL